MSDRDPHRLPDDPSGIEGPHDVLAAEEFAVPMRNPDDLPVDPIHEPHDVLAAEEFAMPTGGVTHQKGVQPRSMLPALILTVVLAALTLRKLRR